MTSSSSMAAAALETRVAALDWQRVEAELDEQGCAKLGGVLSAAECAGLASLYFESSLFRSRVVMARHNYGRGEYQYFRYPLPPLVEALRALLQGEALVFAVRHRPARGRAVRTACSCDMVSVAFTLESA